MRGLMKGLGKARVMKKYGSGKIIEPSDLDHELEGELMKTAKSTTWTDEDVRDVKEEDSE
jgi:hypothetical protein